MAVKKRNPKRKHIRSESTYSFDEVKSLTMDDGTRVVTSADGDIKRLSGGTMPPSPPGPASLPQTTRAPARRNPQGQGMAVIT